MNPKMIQKQEPGKDSSRYLTRLYVIALSCIALFAIIGQILIQHALRKQQEDSYIINVAGRQRMLSQKISKLSLKIEHARQDEEREKYTMDLKGAFSTWTAFHIGLSEGNAQLGLTQENSKKIQALFLSVHPHFIKMAESVQKIIDDPRNASLSAIHVQNILQYEDYFLRGMDSIVTQYQIEAMDKVSFIKRIEIILLALTLLVLLLEGFFIFKPSAVKIRSTIDALKQTQEELKLTNMELEERVRKRTREVYQKNKELKLKNEELYKKNTDLDTFVYTASHDLKAPISNIEGLINQLSPDIPESENKLIVDMMRESIGKFRSVIKDLAEIGKDQAAEKAASHKVTFTDVLNEIKFSIKDLITSSGAIIHEDFSEVPDISISKKHIRSILYNLTSNAIKYCPASRQPEITINTKNLKDYILLQVSDNGMGIKEEDKSKVFSLYQRLQAREDEANFEIEGTGVGMAIVAKIMDVNGGKIEIESTEGKGTTFKVYLKV